ncbi:MAG: dihydroxy-acid dehydratase [Thermoanaerobacteraceae bacterium]|nr:dihydroxy-acid dehydratase [Thermoanaerobacteraceae bacterium]
MTNRELKSQKIREIGSENDSLRYGMDWLEEDLDKPQVLVESTYGQSHPGSFHLNGLVDEVDKGAWESGLKPSNSYATDICDGIAQGHDGMNFSLVSREIIADMVEIHASAEPYDGLMLISSCDKAIPAHLIAAARLNMPTIHVPGGSMITGFGDLTLEQVGAFAADYERGKMTAKEYEFYKFNACPSCGACQFMGTASTHQVLVEALGLALPGSALIPTAFNALGKMARKAGKQIKYLIENNITAHTILTKEAFVNAIMVHAAIGGSTNALLHLPAVAHEVGIELEPELFDEINRKIPYLADIKPGGKYPTEYFYYAGGVPAVMREIKDFLNLDVMTVTGKTLGENMKDLESNGFFKLSEGYLSKFGMEREEVIRPIYSPIQSNGSIAILKGNLAPDGAVVKHSAVSKEMLVHKGQARVFDREEDALNAILKRFIKPGDVIIVRYEGPKGSGMPEMFYTTEALASDSEFVSTTAIITDGRFSGASRGPCIGHVSPEAAEGGPIAFVEDGDIIHIDIPGRRLDIVGINGVEMSPSEIEKVLNERKSKWVKPESRFKSGVQGIYSKLAVSAMKGGYMEV